MSGLLRSTFSAITVGAVAVLAFAAPAASESLSESEVQRVLRASPQMVSAVPQALRGTVALPADGYAPAPYGPAPYGPVSYGRAPCGPAPCAAPCGPARCEPNPCWDPCLRFHVSLGAWAWGVDGTLGDEGREFDVESDFSDSVEETELALDARVRAEWDRWSATLTVNGGTIEESASFEDEFGLASEGEFSIWIVQAQLGFGLFGGRLGCSPCAPVGCLEIYAGARAYWVDQELDIDPGSTVGLTIDSSDEWIDPIVGLRGELHVGTHWSFIAEADIGGFEVGSDLSWHARGEIAYHFSRHFTISAGWKILDVDYENDDFVFDMEMSGPFVSVTVSL